MDFFCGLNFMAAIVMIIFNVMYFSQKRLQNLQTILFKFFMICSLVNIICDFVYGIYNYIPNSFPYLVIILLKILQLMSFYMAFIELCFYTFFFCVTSSKKHILKLIIVIIFSIITILSIYIVSEQLLTGVGLSIIAFFIYETVQEPGKFLDKLTNRFDRNCLLSTIDYAHEKNLDYRILTISINHFKFLNTKFGSANGDEILRTIAKNLPKDNKKYLSFRMSGDSFLIYTTDTESFPELIKSWKEKSTQVWDVNGNQISLAFTITFTREPLKVNSSKRVLSLIEQGIFNARRTNKNNIVCINDAVYSLNRELKVKAAMEKALKNHSFEMYFQPILNRITNRFDKAEALVRLIDSDLGYVQPDEFIALAEQNGLILDIGHQIIEKTCDLMNHYEFKKLGIETVSINLTLLEIIQKNLGFILSANLKKNNLETGDIVLEIRESVSPDIEKEVAAAITSLNEQGFKFALDDYGLGYSNITKILELPFESIKIGKNLLYKSFEDEKSDAILKNTIEMLNSCGYKIAVEGIESTKHLEKMMLLNANYIQGYYFSKPLPVIDLVSFLQTKL